jgi:hypothetical protein
VNFSLSLAVIEKVAAPRVVGIPASRPAWLSLTPAGKEPDVTVNLYLAIPPEADSDVEYLVFLAAGARLVGARVMALGATAMTSFVLTSWGSWKWAVEDSNLRPRPCEGRALTG